MLLDIKMGIKFKDQKETDKLQKKICLSDCLYEIGSTSVPGGNQVDGLPPASSRGIPGGLEIWLKRGWHSFFVEFQIACSQTLSDGI